MANRAPVHCSSFSEFTFVRKWRPSLVSPPFLASVCRAFLASPDHPGGNPDSPAPQERSLAGLGFGIRGSLHLMMCPWILGAIPRSPSGPLAQGGWGDVGTPLTVLVAPGPALAASTVSDSQTPGKHTGELSWPEKCFSFLSFLLLQTRKEQADDPPLGG